MKTLYLWLMLLCALGVQGAANTNLATVYDTVYNRDGTVASRVKVTFQAVHRPLLSALYGLVTTVTTDTNGYYAQRLTADDYGVQYGNDARDSFSIAVPTNVLSYAITNLITTTNLAYTHTTNPSFQERSEKDVAGGYVGLNAIGTTNVPAAFFWPGTWADISVYAGISATTATNIATNAVQRAADLGPINVALFPYFAARDGLTDDSAVIQSAADAAATQNRTVYIPAGDYWMGSNTAWFQCSLDMEPLARFLYGTNDPQPAVKFGVFETNTDFTINYQHWRVGQLVKSATNHNVNSIGIQVGRADHGQLAWDNIWNFTTGIQWRSPSRRNGANTASSGWFIIQAGYIYNAKIYIDIYPKDNGWVNEFLWEGGSLASPACADRRPGYVGIRIMLDDGGLHAPDHHVFNKMSMEGNGLEYVIDCAGAYNFWYSPRFECTPLYIRFQGMDSSHRVYGNKILDGLWSGNPVIEDDYYTNNAYGNTVAGNHTFTEKTYCDKPVWHMLHNTFSSTNLHYAFYEPSVNPNVTPEQWTVAFGPAAGVVVKQKLDPTYRLQLKPDGTINMGDGTGALDTTISRVGPGVVSLGSTGSAAASPIQRDYGIYFDAEASGNNRIVQPLLAAPGSNSFTLLGQLLVPASNPSATRGIFGLSLSTNNTDSAYAFGGEIKSSGELAVFTYGAAVTDARTNVYSAFISTYGGQQVNLAFVRDMTNTLTVCINGVAQTATSSTSAGTDPTWNNTLNGTNLLLGITGTNSSLSAVLSVAALYNRAMTVNEIGQLMGNGIDHSDQWGLLTNLCDSAFYGGFAVNNGGFETLGGGDPDVYAVWLESTYGGSTITDETVDRHSGAHAVKFGVVSTNLCYLRLQNFQTVGNRYRARFFAKADSTEGYPHIDVGSAGGGPLVDTGNLTTSYKEYNLEYVAGTTTFAVIGLATFGVNRTIWVDDMRIEQIGCVSAPDLERANPILSSTVANLNTNSANGLTIGANLMQINPVPQFNAGKLLSTGGIGLPGFGAVTNYFWQCTNAATGEGQWTAVVAGTGSGTVFGVQSNGVQYVITNLNVVGNTKMTNVSGTMSVDMTPGAGGGITSINGDGTVAQTLSTNSDGLVIVHNASGDHKFQIDAALANWRLYPTNSFASQAELLSGTNLLQAAVTAQITAHTNFDVLSATTLIVSSFPALLTTSNALQATIEAASNTVATAANSASNILQGRIESASNTVAVAVKAEGALSTNYTKAEGALSTNFANARALDLTNYVKAEGALSTNFANARALDLTNYTKAEGALSTNFTLARVTDSTNHANGILNSSTNYTDAAVAGRQPTNNTLTLLAGTGAITNINSVVSNTYSLLYTSNATTLLKQMSNGANVTITDNGTHLVIASSGSGGSMSVSTNGTAFASATNITFIKPVGYTNTSGNVSIEYGSGTGGGPSTSNNIPAGVTWLATTNALVDLSLGTAFRFQATANFSIIFTNGTDCEEFTVTIFQDATGNRTCPVLLSNNTAGTSTNMVSFGTDITGIVLTTNALYSDRIKGWFNVGIAGIPNTTNDVSIVGFVRGYR